MRGKPGAAMRSTGKSLNTLLAQEVCQCCWHRLHATVPEATTSSSISSPGSTCLPHNAHCGSSSRQPAPRAEAHMFLSLIWPSSNTARKPEAFVCFAMRIPKSGSTATLVSRGIGTGWVPAGKTAVPNSSRTSQPLLCSPPGFCQWTKDTQLLPPSTSGGSGGAI
eukprot:4899921-Pyramimonas_sp.AAC.1